MILAPSDRLSVKANSSEDERNMLTRQEVLGQMG